MLKINILNYIINIYINQSNNKEWLKLIIITKSFGTERLVRSRDLRLNIKLVLTQTYKWAVVSNKSVLIQTYKWVVVSN